MAEKRKIYFRADAGPEIGYGHYIRSLALADMLKQDFECTMFTQMPTDYQLREVEHVCSIVALSGTNAKFDEFLNHLHGDEIVVLDNYFFTTDYQRAIKAKGCKLVCIDDMHDKHYVADVIINHGCTDESLFDVEPYTRLCLGLNYALLRKPFLETHDDVNRVKGIVVVCFGGSDPHNLTKRYAEHLIMSQGVEQVIAVVGDGYQHRETLCLLPKVEVRSRLSADAMANLFRSAEAVVCSASTTAYEALACGTKVYTGWYVENQKEIYKMLRNGNYIIPLGKLDNSESRLIIDEDLYSENTFVSTIGNIKNVFFQL